MTQTTRKRIAVVSMGVKLGDETRGYTRFKVIAEMLVRAGFDVDLITTSFQHWNKAQRSIHDACYQQEAFRTVFIPEPGYKKNLDIRRIISHRICAQNLKRYLLGGAHAAVCGEIQSKTPVCAQGNAHSKAQSETRGVRYAETQREAQSETRDVEHVETQRKAYTTHTPYDLIYAEIPPNDVARVCAEVAEMQHIPFVVDVNDLWPEAMRLAFSVPVLSHLLFYPFSRDARYVYRHIDACIGTSDEYAGRPARDRTQPYEHYTVYVGNQREKFDAAARKNASLISKNEQEFWVTYAGTLGASYDIETLIDAAAKLQALTPQLRVKILGDGPERTTLEARAQSTHAPVDFLGYLDYQQMAAYLCASDVVVNSLKAHAAQSIVTKIGDYLASTSALINTGSSKEFREKVISDGFGMNVDAENVESLASAMQYLYEHPKERDEMARKGRLIAEEQFDQARSYLTIVNLIKKLTHSET